MTKEAESFSSLEKRYLELVDDPAMKPALEQIGVIFPEPSKHVEEIKLMLELVNLRKSEAYYRQRVKKLAKKIGRARSEIKHVFEAVRNVISSRGFLKTVSARKRKRGRY